jgi:hypothetical protein
MDEWPILPTNAIEALAWIVQGALIVWSLRGQPGAGRLASPGWAACGLVVALAWVWRLSYLNALSSEGVLYWMGDDPLRWLNAWAWSVGEPSIGPPYWLPATSVLHGTAMRWLDEPIGASKLVSSLYQGASLLGLLVFAYAIARSRMLACVSVALAAPWWLHVLLGTGTMTELPVMALTLGGGAALLLADREPRPRRRRALLVGAAVTFAASTTFHLVAWLQLAGVLPVLLLAWLARDDVPWRRSLSAFAGLAAIALAYCGLWLVDTWIETGSPLPEAGVLAGWSLPSAKLGERVDPGALLSLGTGSASGVGEELRKVAGNALIYPRALAWQLRFFLPLVVYGVVRVLLARGRDAAPRRVVLAAIGAVLGVLVATAVVAGTNRSPYRTVVPLATALLPIALLPVLPRRREAARGEQERVRSWRTALAPVGLAVLLVLQAVDGHRRVLDPSDAPLEVVRPMPDVRALGAWLRAEAAAPGLLEARHFAHPFYVWMSTRSLAGLYRVLLEYEIGHPDWTLPVEPDWERPPLDEAIDALVPGQLIFTDRVVPGRKLRLIATVARFRVYERRPDAPAGRR